MLSNFTKYWVTITCAPDSIRNLRNNNSSSLDAVANEDKSKIICVLSNDNGVLSIGYKLEDLKKENKMSFSDAANFIAKEFDLLSIYV